MNRWTTRTLLLIFAAAYFFALAGSAMEAWVAEHPTEARLQRLARFRVAGPAAWESVARTGLLSFRRAELENAAEDYRQALSRNPLNPQAWDHLASIYGRLDDSPAEDSALRGELAAQPNSSAASWHLGNSRLAEGRYAEAFPLLRTAAAHDPELRVPLFDIGWKLLGDPRQILSQLVPPGLDSRMDFFSYLVWQRGALTQALPVWQKIAQAAEGANRAIAASDGGAYVDSLAGAGMGTEASLVWRDVLRLSGSADPQAAPGGELMTNGSFESEILGRGLGWRLFPEPGSRINIDHLVPRQGGRSLRVTFDGTANPDFSGVRQWIPVEPGRRYRFEAFIKTENISTDNGLYFELQTQAAPAEEQWDQSTPELAGTHEWTRQQLDFQTGAHTRVIQVLLRRRHSGKLNNLLRGAVWMDELSIRPVSP